jgi:Na+/melibiose symporter-like transporter
VIWAALTLIVAVAIAGAWACYLTRRHLAAISDDQQRRLALRGARLSLAVGGAVLLLGLFAFVVTGYDWVALVAIWPYGLLHIGLLVWALHRTRKRSGFAAPLR